MRYLAGFFCMMAAFVMALSHANASSIRTGGVTSQPAGHFDYCRSGGKHCGAHRDAGPVAHSTSTMRTLASVTARVNASIKPVSDMQNHGRAEKWSNGGRKGDCEDFALKKRSILLSKGFHPSQLPLAKTRLRNGEAHIVLVVRTTQGDYVLDNLNNAVKPWRSSGLRFLKMQSSTNSSQWVSIRG